MQLVQDAQERRRAMVKDGRCNLILAFRILKAGLIPDVSRFRKSIHRLILLSENGICRSGEIVEAGIIKVAGKVRGIDKGAQSFMDIHEAMLRQKLFLI